MTRVLFAGGGTGGHLMPALALAEVLGAARPDVEPVLVGAARPFEADVLPRYPFRYHLLPVEPLHRRAWWRNARWPLVAWRLWRALRDLFAAERPAAVVGTGGYAAGPVVWYAQRRGIPTAIQEQNALPGLATRLLARGARQVHLGFPEAGARLRVSAATAVYALGNPIRPPVPGDRGDAHRAFGLDPARRTVLVVGGSQGARGINRAVAGALESGRFPDANLLWGSGVAQLAEFARCETPGRIAVRGFIDPISIGYRAADLVVCRAGAMTVAEVCAWGKASILVPLPTAAADHQTRNARALAETGAAVLLPESDLTPASLGRTLADLLGDARRLETLAAGARARGRPDAAKEVVSRLLTLIL